MITSIFSKQEVILDLLLTNRKKLNENVAIKSPMEQLTSNHINSKEQVRAQRVLNFQKKANLRIKKK